MPTLIWYFKKEKLPLYKMLDVMAITTCLVHMFGRLGCFMAGCCYGKPTDSFLGVVFTDPACQAPLNASLFPTQLMEAFYILLVMVVLLLIRNTRTFYGQLFLLYLIFYAIGRFVLEYFRKEAIDIAHKIPGWQDIYRMKQERSDADIVIIIGKELLNKIP